MLSECCVRYLRHVIAVDRDWLQWVSDHAGTTDVQERENALDYLHVVFGRTPWDDLNSTVPLLIDIFEGKRSCPWHDNVPEDYLAAMNAMRYGSEASA